MKNIIISIFCLSLFGQTIIYSKEIKQSMKTLVIYYSLTGHTKAVAVELALKLNADLRKIENMATLKIGPWLFITGGFASVFNKQWKIKPVDLNLANYDRIFIGSPVWAGKSVPTVNTFLANTDFTGKSVIPFVTMGGPNGKSAIKNLSKKISEKGGKIVSSFSVRAGKKPEDTLIKAKEIIEQYVNK